MPRYTEADARAAVAASMSHAEALRRLNVRAAGGNHRLFKSWLARWSISTDHFDPHAARADSLRAHNRPVPLQKVLVEGSTYSRAALKRRLLATGLKQPECELCGQDERWRGGRMALILDHVNGVPDDNRLENLRIVCPNCAATFDTHCARKIRQAPVEISCGVCGGTFLARRARQKYCGSRCGELGRQIALSVPRPERRKVERPPYEELKAQLAATSYLAVGRKYGVSDNAVRKWVRQYEAEEEVRQRAA